MSNERLFREQGFQIFFSFVALFIRFPGVSEDVKLEWRKQGAIYHFLLFSYCIE